MVFCSCRCGPWGLHRIFGLLGDQLWLSATLTGSALVAGEASENLVLAVATQAVNSASGTAWITIGMREWLVPQTWLHSPTKVPTASALNQVSMVRPGIAYRCTPSDGMNQLWMTSPLLVSTRMFLPTGTTSSLSTDSMRNLPCLAA